MSTPNPPQHHRDRTYFAFGSNLHLVQMAKRCPQSRYIGLAYLHHYRFQINQRGFANVVPSFGDRVEGLAYLLSRDDETRLDKNEGVSAGAYQKHLLDVEVSTAAIELVGRRVPEVAQSLHEPELYSATREKTARAIPKSSLNHAHQAGDRAKSIWTSASMITRALPRGRKVHDQYGKTGIDAEGRARPVSVGSVSVQAISGSGQTTRALVYLNPDIQEDSKPRDEYVNRMNAGIVDARKLGMSEVYITNCLRHYIPDLETFNGQSASSLRGLPGSRYRVQDKRPKNHGPRYRSKAREQSSSTTEDSSTGDSKSDSDEPRHQHGRATYMISNPKQTLYENKFSLR